MTQTLLIAADSWSSGPSWSPSPSWSYRLSLALHAFQVLFSPHCMAWSRTLHAVTVKPGQGPGLVPGSGQGQDNEGPRTEMSVRARIMMIE